MNSRYNKLHNTKNYCEIIETWRLCLINEAYSNFCTVLSKHSLRNYSSEIISCVIIPLAFMLYTCGVISAIWWPNACKCDSEWHDSNESDSSWQYLVTVVKHHMFCWSNIPCIYKLFHSWMFVYTTYYSFSSQSYSTQYVSVSLLKCH
jgi:hypothetical protein